MKRDNAMTLVEVVNHFGNDHEVTIKFVACDYGITYAAHAEQSFNNYESKKSFWVICLDYHAEYGW